MTKVMKGNKTGKSKFFASGVGRILVIIFVLLIAGLTIYSSALLDLSSAVLHREGSSHGLFVPFLSGYLLWIKYERIKEIKPQVNWLYGSCVLLIGLFLLLLSFFTNYFILFSILSYVCLAGGLVLLFFGLDLFKVIAFPLFFLVTMVPIPQEIYAQISIWMRMATTWGSVLVTKNLGVPLYREDFHIFIPGVNLFVANSCSGIRYLLSYFVFSIIYAALFKRSFTGRFAIIAGSIPLSIFAGITRLSIIFLAAYHISPAMAEHRPHVLISWAVFAIILFGSIGIDQYCSRDKVKMEKEKRTLPLD